MRRKRKAQSAIEYMILLGAMTVVALVGFSKYLPQTKELATKMFNETANQIMGPPAESIGKARSYVGADGYP